jgi:hypothetical protein
MSANQDKNEKFRFVYSNLYQIHGKKIETVPPKKGLVSTQVLKTEDLKSGPLASVRVSSYSPTEIAGKKVPRPSVIPSSQEQNRALESLKQNLKTLNDLQARLRFMLEELEDLVKD